MSRALLMAMVANFRNMGIQLSCKYARFNAAVNMNMWQTKHDLDTLQ
jgi:hypothetical protein